MEMTHCTICPLSCGADRTKYAGRCGGGALPKVALATVHWGEEPPLIGTKGSGAIFFSGCNLGCVFCQNFDISQEGKGKEISILRLADIFLEQQGRGVHNINLVSGGHFVPQIAAALQIAKQQGMTIPVVYNSNGYEKVETLQHLDGLIDVYLPDMKYFDDTLANTYSHSPGYFEVASKAVLEMKRQVGEPIYTKEGILQRGLMLRHLVLPGCRKDSEKILQWVAENLGTETTVSLLRQYTPMYRAAEHKEINRRLTTFEYEKVVDFFFDLGLHNGFMQEKESATTAETPVFDLRGI